MGEETNAYGMFFDADGKPLGDNTRTVTLHSDKFEVVEHGERMDAHVELTKDQDGYRCLGVDARVTLGELLQLVKEIGRAM